MGTAKTNTAEFIQATVKNIPQTEWLINNRNLFLTVLEAGRLRSGWQHGWIPVRPYSRWQTPDFLLCLHMAERELSGVPFIRALNPFMRAPPS